MKEKNNEIYENFETDDNKEEENTKKKSKSKLAKPLIIFIAFLFIFVGFIYYKYFHRSSDSLNMTLLEEYNELGKKMKICIYLCLMNFLLKEEKENL